MWKLFLTCVALFTYGCAANRGAAVVQPQQYAITEGIDTTVKGDGISEMVETITPYRDQLSEEMNRVVAQIATPLTKGRPESTLGNWVADILAQSATDLFPDKKIAFAVQNYGGIRTGEIGAGPLVVSEIFELMPFDNELVLVALTGQELERFVDYMIEGGGWPVSSGLSVSVHNGGKQISVNGAAIDPDHNYFVALPDYVAGGGDGADFFIGKPRLSSQRMIRDLLIEYAGKAPGPIAVGSTGSRFKID